MEGTDIFEVAVQAAQVKVRRAKDGWISIRIIATPSEMRRLAGTLLSLTEDYRPLGYMPRRQDGV